MQPRLRQYQDLLREFEAEVTPRKMFTRTKYSAILSQIDANRRASHQHLDQEETELCRQLEDLESRRATVNTELEGEIASVNAKWSKADYKSANALSRDLKSFTLENQVRRLLNSMPAGKASKLVVALHEGYTKSSPDQLNQHMTQAAPIDQEVLDASSPNRSMTLPLVDQSRDGDRSTSPRDASHANEAEHDDATSADVIDIAGAESDEFHLPQTPVERAFARWATNRHDADPSFEFLREGDVG